MTEASRMASQNESFRPFFEKTQSHKKIVSQPSLKQSNYLKKIISELTKHSESLKSFGPEVYYLTTSKNILSRSVPVNRFFLEPKQIKQLDYENELAAVISIEIAHQLLGHLSRLEASQNSMDLLTMKITLSEKKRAISRAAKIMHDGGYDLRGLPELWKKFKVKKIKSSWSEAEVKELLEHSYREISKLTPLRNPIVKTNSFVRFKKDLDIK